MYQVSIPRRIGWPIWNFEFPYGYFQFRRIARRRFHTFASLLFSNGAILHLIRRRAGSTRGSDRAPHTRSLGKHLPRVSHTETLIPSKLPPFHAVPFRSEVPTRTKTSPPRRSLAPVPLNKRGPRFSLAIRIEMSTPPTRDSRFSARATPS